MRSRYKITEEDGVYFVTSTVTAWLPVFTSREYFEIVVDALRFCQEKKALMLYAYVILENYFHLVVSGSDLPNIMQSLQRHTSRQIIQVLKTHRKEGLLNQLVFYKKKYKSEKHLSSLAGGFSSLN